MSPPRSASALPAQWRDHTTPRIAFLVGGAGGLLATLAVAVAFRHIARRVT